ncbi:outer membrane beta-barrel protein [Verrucomicrobiota bacterium]
MINQINKWFGLFFIVLLACILLGMNVFAQGNAEVRFSPVQFSIGIHGESTDNRDSAEENVDNNYDLHVKPRLEAVFDWEQTLLDFDYIPSYRYRDNPSPIQNEIEWLHKLNIGFNHWLTPRVKMSLGEKFDFTDDPSIESAGSTLRRDSSYTRNLADAGFNFEISRMSSLDISGRHMIKRYDDDIRAEESDEDSTGGSVIYLRQVSRTVGLMFVADADTFDYKSEQQGLDRGFSAVFGGVGVKKVFNPSLNGKVRVGWQSANYDVDDVDVQNTPYVSLSLDAETAIDTKFLFEATSRIRDSDVYPFVSQKNMRFKIRYTRDIVKNITLGIAGTYEMGEYDEKDTSPSVPDSLYVKDRSGEETTIIFVGDITYKIVSLDSSIKIYQQYEEVDSDVGISFSRNATGLALVKNF